MTFIAGYLARKDKLAFALLEEKVKSYSIKEVLDTKKCIHFLENFKAGNLQETELLGSLATMCLSFKYLNL